MHENALLVGSGWFVTEVVTSADYTRCGVTNLVSRASPPTLLSIVKQNSLPTAKTAIAGLTASGVQRQHHGLRISEAEKVVLSPSCRVLGLHDSNGKLLKSLLRELKYINLTRMIVFTCFLSR